MRFYAGFREVIGGIIGASSPITENKIEKNMEHEIEHESIAAYRELGFQKVERTFFWRVPMRSKDSSLNPKPQTLCSPIIAFSISFPLL